MRAYRVGSVMVLLSLGYALAALLLPLEVVEILGAPLVVAGAYYLGLRGGIVVALWATLIATVAFLSIHEGDLEDYIVTAVGYVVIGVLVGLAVDRFARQKRDLEDAVEAAGLARKQFAASEGRYRLLFEQSADPVYLHGLDAGRRAHPIPRRQRRDLQAARLHARGASRPDAARHRCGAGARPAAADDGRAAARRSGALRERPSQA